MGDGYLCPVSCRGLLCWATYSDTYAFAHSDGGGPCAKPNVNVTGTSGLCPGSGCPGGCGYRRGIV